MKIPLYGNKKLIAAFEFGMNLDAVCREQKVEVTKEIFLRAENILVNELSAKPHNIFVMETIPNILAAIEPKEDIPSVS